MSRYCVESFIDLIRDNLNHELSHGGSHLQLNMQNIYDTFLSMPTDHVDALHHDLFGHFPGYQEDIRARRSYRHDDRAREICDYIFAYSLVRALNNSSHNASVTNDVIRQTLITSFFTALNNIRGVVGTSGRPRVIHYSEIIEAARMVHLSERDSDTIIKVLDQLKLLGELYDLADINTATRHARIGLIRLYLRRNLFQPQQIFFVTLLNDALISRSIRTLYFLRDSGIFRFYDQYGIFRGHFPSPYLNYLDRPLIYAAERGFLGAVDFLLNQGLSPHVVGVYRQNPLHAAALHVNRVSIDIIDRLLIAGANPMAEDFMGHTPFEVAIRSFNYQVFDVLYQAMNPSWFSEAVIANLRGLVRSSIRNPARIIRRRVISRFHQEFNRVISNARQNQSDEMQNQNITLTTRSSDVSSSPALSISTNCNRQ